MTNEELLQRYKGGDASALEQLYEQNTGLIWRIAEKCLMDFGYLPQGAEAARKADSHTAELSQELFSEGSLVFCEQIYSGTYDTSLGKLTTYLYPFIKGAMYRWLERHRDDTISTIHLCDLFPDEECSEPLELPNMRSQSVDYIVYQKICLELLRDLFNELSEKDRSILGHSFGVYGYEKYTLDQLGLKEMLTAGGVVKAKEAALLRLHRLYEGSKLQLWRSVHLTLST